MFGTGMMKVMAGVMVALVIAVLGTGWLLKRSWDDNAIYAANEKQYLQTIDDQNSRYRQLIREKAAVEEELAANAGEKEKHQEVVERVEYITRTIQKEVPVGDCINQPVPDDLFECLQQESCSPSGGEGAGVPAGEPDPAYP